MLLADLCCFLVSQRHIHQRTMGARLRVAVEPTTAAQTKTAPTTRRDHSHDQLTQRVANVFEQVIWQIHPSSCVEGSGQRLTFSGQIIAPRPTVGAGWPFFSKALGSQRL